MPEIEVVFPQNEDPYVDKVTQIARYRQRVDWRFYVPNENVRWVEVSFDNASFFAGGAATNLRLSDQTFIAQVSDEGQALIYGTVPRADRTKEDKYSVRGYAADPRDKPKPNPIAELDPKIVTAVP